MGLPENLSKSVFTRVPTVKNQSLMIYIIR